LTAPPPTPLAPPTRVGLDRGKDTGALRLLGLLLMLLAAATPALGQGLEFEGRPVRQITIDGLERIESRYVENQLRSQVGRPYDESIVQQDIVRITNLGYFSRVTAKADPTDDGGVALTYRVQELPILTGVEVRGNRAIASAELRAVMLLRAGDAVDPFLVERARRAIEEAYEARGYFVTDVTVDENALAEERRLVLLIREGPRIRVRKIEFEGNAALPEAQLREQIQTDEWFPLFGTRHVVNREELRLDATRLRDYYRDRGYLEAQVDRRITVSTDQRDAIVTFQITEGPRWTVDEIAFRGRGDQALIFPPEQLRQHMALKRGEVYSERKLNESARNLLELYGKLGYLETRLIRRNTNDRAATGIDRLFNPENNTVDLVVTIDQGQPTTVGKVIVRGNDVTRTKVILRELRGITPGRRFDRAGYELTQRRLNETPLFANATTTVLGEPGDEQRDVLVEVTERNTGSISFGATISSDAGLLGAIDVTQRNFDVTDLPESWSDLLSNRAFRGGGQTFNLTLQPGSENSRYAVGLSDPFFLDTNYFADVDLSFTDNDRDEYDERRSGGRLGLGKRFGDVWSASVRGRADNVRIRDIEDDASLDVFEVAGTNLLTAVSFRLTRDTTDSNLAPSRGSRTTGSIERTGVFGGDYNYTKAAVSYDKFWTVAEDFLERKSVLRFRLDGGYIFEEEEAPIFERFFAGGHTSLRGFDPRGVGPRGIRNDTLTLGDDAVGGRYLLLAGLQYEFPLIDRYLRGVVFTDQGTLANDITLDNWRVSVGFGIRLQVAALSQAPFAIDFAIPIVSEATDEERAISFAIDIPFQ
jgi:outer membrane protein insertion porin family